MIIKKQDILTLPLQDIAHLELPEVESWCEQNQLDHYATWTLPQMLAHFGSWTLAKTAEGPWDVVKTLQQNIVSDWHRGLWKLTRIKRRFLMPKQIAQAEYATFTPLILAGLKKMQGVRYESWRDCPRLGLLLEPDLFGAVVLEPTEYETLGSLGSDRLLEIREMGLVTQSGKTAGKVKPAESTWALAGIKDTEIGHLPKLTQTMATQCWLAHPKHRSQYMILDPQNWDHMPEPLIGSEIFQQPTQTLALKKAKLEPEDLPF